MGSNLGLVGVLLVVFVVLKLVVVCTALGYATGSSLRDEPQWTYRR